MAKARPLRFRLPLYLIPILIGLCGILFASQFTDPVWKGILLFLSVSLPLFFGGNLLARLHMRGIERAIAITGVLMLMIGAVAAISGIAESLDRVQDVPESVIRLSRYVGIASLMLGLLAVIFLVIRSDEAIELIGERFKQLAEQTGEGLIFAMPDGTVSMVNERLLRLTGLVEPDFVGKDINEIPVRIDSSIMLPHLPKREAQGITEYEHEWTREGKIYYFGISVAPLYNRYGRLAGGFAVVRDITQQKRLAKRLENYAQTLEKLVEDRTEQLRKSEGQLRDLLLNMSEGFVTVDESFTVHFANQRILGILGVTREEFEGSTFTRYLDAQGRQVLMDALDAARSGHPHRMRQELSLIRTDGTGVSSMLAVSPIPAEGVEGARYSLVVTDITEVKLMHDQLEQRAAELESANEELKLLDRAKDSLLANVSHELRTPLSTVRGYVEMMLTASPESIGPQQRTSLSIISRNVDRLGQLIDEIISFSRMQIRGIDLTFSLFEVAQLIRDCYNSAKPKLDARAITFSMDVPGEMPLMWGDRKSLEQVLGILLSNAIKFSSDRSSIEAIVSCHESDVRLSIVDHGIGIDPAFHKRVFDKFFQVDSTLARRYEGVGIGLSIAKSIVEAHGGEIELHSEIAKGATFTVVLPRCGVRRPSSESGNDFLAARRIIVMIEDATTAQTLSEVMARQGASVRVVTNVFECARAAAVEVPDVLVLDESIESKTGATTIDQLQEHDATRMLPILRLTNGPVASTQLPPISNPIYVLEKPFSLDEFQRALNFAFLGEAPEVLDRIESSGDATSRRMRRVLFVDTDSDLQEWVSSSLLREHIECVCISDVRALPGILGNYSPDVVFADVDNAVADASLTILDECRTERGMRVYAMTAYPAIDGAGNGFAGYLRKPFTLKEMLALVNEATPSAQRTLV